jgi:hypothetical protein
MNKLNKDAQKQLDCIQFHPPIFPSLIAPHGFLTNKRQTHALWYYYLSARQAYENIVVDPIVYEGEDDPSADFRQLIERIAIIYGVSVEEMVKCWDVVDMQCFALKLPKLPDEERYRFNRIGRVN